MARLLGLALAAVIAVGSISLDSARAQNWTGATSTDWNTASNWDSGTVPNSPTTAVNFTGAAPGPVNVSASVQARSLTFGTPLGLYSGYTLTSSSGVVLSGVTTISLGSAGQLTQTINLSSVPTGSLLFPAGSNLTVVNNQSNGYGGSLAIGPNTVIGTPGSGGVVVTGPGTTVISGSFAGVTGGLTVAGGETALSGDCSSLAGGVNVATGATLYLDYSTNTATKLGTGALTTNGGTVYVNSLTAVTQTIPGGIVIGAGCSTFTGGGSVVTLNAPITRNLGGTADFGQLGTYGATPNLAIVTSTGTTNGLLGIGPAFATVGGYDWATVSGGMVAPVSNYGTDFTPGTNVNVIASSTQNSFTTNSLRFGPSGLTLTLSGTNVLQSGGILLPNAAANETVTGGTLTAAGAGELIVQNFARYSTFTINSALVSAVGLTLNGPVSLGGINIGLTGPINVNAGSLAVTNVAAVNSASQINLNTGSSLYNAGLVVNLGNNVNGTIITPIQLTSSAGIGQYAPNSQVAFAGVISSVAGQTTPITISSAGGFNLTGANTFNGDVTLYSGVLGVNSDASLGSSKNSLFVTGFGGNGLLFLNGGVSFTHAISLGLNTTIACNGTDSNTISGQISGASLVKVGTGTLTLSGANTYGGATINAGTLAVTNDAALGSGPLALGPLGTLNYSGTTASARAFPLGGGLLAVSAGATLTVNGGPVTSGFLGGPGTIATGAGIGTAFANITSRPAAVIASNSGLDQFFDFTNGGQLNIAAGLGTPVSFNGFTNQGSGSITIGPASSVTAADFQTYGLLTISPGPDANHITLLTNNGATAIYFNGGSRTFIGTIGGNGQAQLELNGQNAIVAGGLFVNNGHVTDSSAAGISTVIADYGALVKGAGQYDNSPITQNGGKFQAGNSPGVATVGRFVFGPGGVSNYVFAIDDATGTAGPTPDALGHVSGWGLVKAASWQRVAGATSGDFVFAADASHPLTVAIDTLVNPTTAGTDVSGLMADFDPTRSYSWPAVEWTGTYSGPTDVAALDAATNFDTSGFVNPVDGTFGWSLSVAQALSLSYTPSAVPEPGTLALVGAAAICAAARRRCRRRIGASGR